MRERAADIQVEREKATLVDKTVSRVIKSEVRFLPDAWIVAFDLVGEVYAAIRVAYIESNELLITCRVTSTISY